MTSPFKAEPIPGPPGTGVVVTWPREGALNAGDQGEWASFPQYPHKTVTVDGDGEIVLEGENLPGSWHELRDEHGARIGGPGCYVVRANPMKIRPIVPEGRVVVTIVAVAG